MTHNVGSVQSVSPATTIGPDSGVPESSPNTWAHSFTHTPAPGGTKFLMLHVVNANLPAANRLEVDLGYDMDVFTAADGSNFWTRPINITAFPGGNVPIRYITDGASSGSVQIDLYGRGESLPGDPGHPSFSNCDPFLVSGSYAEPTYDPFWFCSSPPNWENVDCIPGGDIRRTVAQSVGMILTVHGSSVSTCSVTCIGPDTVITAGHCLPVPEIEALTSSVSFDYQTTCGGGKPAGYNPRFFKVIKVLKFRNQTVGGTYFDYCILQLKVPPAGIGVPPLTMRDSIPAPGEQVYGIHHPNGAVKKLSIPHPGFETVNSSGPGGVFTDIDVSGGSSGSGLFDTAGRIVGVLSNGSSCSLRYFPTSTILQDIATTPQPSPAQDVMIVFDRSGSMSAAAGTGRTKIEEARDAASLFVQLIREGSGNRIGLESFSTTASSPADFTLTAVNGTAKNTLIGPAPYSGGIVGGLTPDGWTTIGGGLDGARLQFPAPGANPRTILVLSDGLQNTPPMVEAVEPSLGGIDIHVIGFGTESSLDGTLLNRLAQSHDGLYTRAGTGLELKKFFALAFGDIFEAGELMDPEYFLPASQDAAAPIPFHVCGEETITIVLGWAEANASLLLELISPAGAIITSGSPAVEDATGRTWTYLRANLPYDGERDGVWQVRVVRPQPIPIPAVASHVDVDDMAAATQAVDVHYFVSVIAKGGPLLRHVRYAQTFYSGDVVNPLVELKYPDNSTPHHAKVMLTVTRPSDSVGNVLVKSKLGPPLAIDGDIIPARQATLMALEATSGTPVASYVTETYELHDDPAHTFGIFEPAGIYGNPLPELMRVEGNYTFRALATYGEDCIATREASWSIFVSIGIDPDNTQVTAEPVGTLPDGRIRVRVTFTPRDRYGNYLGPGRSDSFDVQVHAGCELLGAVQDQGDGSYTQDVACDPQSDELPGLVVTQPERPSVVLQPTPPAKRGRYSYSVKFVCGIQGKCKCEQAPVRPGRYATEINIHNYHDVEVQVVKYVTPLVFAGAVNGREPKVATRKAADRILLPPHSATMDDCQRISELLLGAVPAVDLPITIGFLEIVSSHELDVTAVYTSSDLKSRSISMDVERIEGRKIDDPKRDSSTSRLVSRHEGHAIE